MEIKEYTKSCFEDVFNTVKLIQKNTLSEMLDNINEQNIHKEIETGAVVGKEIW